MPGFRMEKVVNKGLSDTEILSAAGFINITDEPDGKKTAVKERIIYGGLSVSTKEQDETQVLATIDYASIQHPLHRDPPPKPEAKKK